MPGIATRAALVLMILDAYAFGDHVEDAALVRRVRTLRRLAHRRPAARFSQDHETMGDDLDAPTG